MTTKPSNVGLDRGIYSSPFDAFTNYMNILGDFINRVNSLYPDEIDNEELDSLLTTIKNQGDEIEMKDNEIVRLKAKVTKMQEEELKLKDKVEKLSEKKKAEAKKTTKKTAAAKKTTTRKAAPKTASAKAAKTETAPANAEEEKK